MVNNENRQRTIKISTRNKRNVNERMHVDFDERMRGQRAREINFNFEGKGVNAKVLLLAKQHRAFRTAGPERVLGY